MWFAHVTVANVVTLDNKFLMVKEFSDGRLVFNQPAGHVEDNETIVQAVIRETLEETGWHVNPKQALGISQFRTANNATYIRHSFISEVEHFDPHYQIDSDIREVLWMSHEELLANAPSMRSPMVLSDIERFMNGTRFVIDELYVPDRNTSRA